MARPLYRFVRGDLHRSSDFRLYAPRERNPNGATSAVARRPRQMLGCARVGPRVGSTSARRVGCFRGTVPPSVLSLGRQPGGGLWQYSNILPSGGSTDRVLDPQLVRCRPLAAVFPVATGTRTNCVNPTEFGRARSSACSCRTSLSRSPPSAHHWY
jgi:hypothetical protein